MKIRKIILSRCCIITFLLLIYGCSTGEYAINPAEIQLKGGGPPIYRIQSLDVILVAFPLTEKHTQEVTVRPDGSIIIDVAGEIEAAGMTPAELAESIKKHSSRRLRNPEVEVTVVESSQKVYVGGEVRSPGVVPFYENLTALQAVFERGGFLRTAQSNNILLIRADADKEQMNITSIKTKDIASLSVLPSDVIFVPKTGVAKANVAMSQFIRNMLPFDVTRVIR